VDEHRVAIDHHVLLRTVRGKLERRDARVGVHDKRERPVRQTKRRAETKQGIEWLELVCVLDASEVRHCPIAGVDERFTIERYGVVGELVVQLQTGRTDARKPSW